jgi:transposase-like protein
MSVWFRLSHDKVKKMKPNKENPICPKCGSLTAKMGYLPTVEGKKRRYRCGECGHTFTEGVSIVNN